MDIDYYEILEIERTATKEQIASAYRKAAMKYHPDRNPGNPEAVEKFKAVAEAFEVLNDPEKRQIYDRYGREGLNNQATGGGGDYGNPFSTFSDLFGDSIFGSFFGGGGTRQARQGGDVRTTLSLDLHEAARGVTREIRYRRQEICEKCGGSGAAPGTKPETCRFCGGHGQVQKSAGIFTMRIPCPKCQGTGKVIPTPCPHCHGKGVVWREVTREIRIPAGIESGTKLRIQGEGNQMPDGYPGDCYVFLQIKPHPFFHRDGMNLVCRVPIRYAQAALGGEIEIPTLDGTERIKIPAGTQNDDVIKLRGRGMPTPRRNAVGDLLIQVYIEVPRKMTPEYENLLRKIAEIDGDTVFPQRNGFGSKLKNFLSDFFSPKEKEKDREEESAKKPDGDSPSGDDDGKAGERGSKDRKEKTISKDKKKK